MSPYFRVMPLGAAWWLKSAASCRDFRGISAVSAESAKANTPNRLLKNPVAPKLMA
jgi:hypothetical protein